MLKIKKNMELKGTVNMVDGLYYQALELAVIDYLEDQDRDFETLILDRLNDSLDEHFSLDREDINKAVKDAKAHAISILTNL